LSSSSIYIVVSSLFVLVIGYDIIAWLNDRSIESPEIRLKRSRIRLQTTVLILGFALTLVSVLFHVNILSYSKPIPFKYIDKITLKDFKGYRKPFETLYGEKGFAFITTTLDYTIQENQLEVNALFHPSRSYTYDDRFDRLLLKHELYHFRITEVFARKCRMALAQKEMPSKENIEKCLAQLNLSENEMQQQYDRESFHGYVMKSQIRWEKRIDSLLVLTKEYEETRITY
jgi:hypothetical protein